MQAKIIEFTNLLRKSGLRVSVAEGLDIVDNPINLAPLEFGADVPYAVIYGVRVGVGGVLLRQGIARPGHSELTLNFIDLKVFDSILGSLTVASFKMAVSSPPITTVFPAGILKTGTKSLPMHIPSLVMLLICPLSPSAVMTLTF